MLTDPEIGACKAAHTLFHLPALQANSQLPIATGSIATGWSLGVLSTVADQLTFLSEIRRVLQPHARFGLLVYCATRAGELRLQQPEGNDFPTDAGLKELLHRSSLRVLNSGWVNDFATFRPAGMKRR